MDTQNNQPEMSNTELVKVTVIKFGTWENDQIIFRVSNPRLTEIADEFNKVCSVYFEDLSDKQIEEILFDTIRTIKAITRATGMKGERYNGQTHNNW